jgi:hypothetical protein
MACVVIALATTYHYNQVSWSPLFHDQSYNYSQINIPMTNMRKKKRMNDAGVEADNGLGSTLTAISPVATPENSAGMGSNGPVSVDDSQVGATAGDAAIAAQPNAKPMSGTSLEGTGTATAHLEAQKTKEVQPEDDSECAGYTSPPTDSNTTNRGKK